MNELGVVGFGHIGTYIRDMHGDAEEDSGEEYCFFGKSHYLCLIVTDKGMIFR